MPVATQFCIGIENEAGVLAALCARLCKAGVNVDALYVADEEDSCWVNFVASPVPVASEVLAREGYNFFTEQVLVVEVQDEPGELESVSSKLAAAGINMNYVYGSCTRGCCTLVINVDELERAASAIA